MISWILKINYKSFFFFYYLLYHAYSEYIIPGGGNIGIEVNSDGIMVVGFYEVNGKNIGKNSGFQVGDRIIKVSGNNVTSIDNMVKLINTTMQNNIVNFTVLRANKMEKYLKLG